jgi:hypothetical protein
MFSINMGKYSTDAAAAATQPRAPTGGSAGAAVVAAAAVAAAAAGWLVWRRLRRPALRPLDRKPLLASPSQRAQRSSGTRCVEVQPSAALPPTRRRRLDSVLQRETLSGSRCITMRPVQAVPPQLAHQLASRRRGGAPASPFGAPAGEVELGPAGWAAAGCSNGDEQRWGLDTASLQLQEGELQVGNARLNSARHAWRTCCPSPFPVLLLHNPSSFPCALPSPELQSLPGQLLRLLRGTSARFRRIKSLTLGTAKLRCLPRSSQLVVGSDGLLRVLGEGSHAVVYLGVLSGLEVAVKVGGGCCSARRGLD